MTWSWGADPEGNGDQSNWLVRFLRWAAGFPGRRGMSCTSWLVMEIMASLCQLGWTMKGQKQVVWIGYQRGAQGVGFWAAAFGSLQPDFHEGCRQGLQCSGVFSSNDARGPLSWVSLKQGPGSGVIQEVMLLQKVSAKDEFFLEFLDDPEFVALVFRSEVDLQYHRAKVM